jgi:hypothetical protein
VDKSATGCPQCAAPLAWWGQYHGAIIPLAPDGALTSAKENLEESIDKYPGVSSWKMFLSGEHTKKWKRIHRPAYRALGPHEHNLEGYTREARRLERSAGKAHSFTLEPNAWLGAFGITDPEEQRGYNQRLMERVRAIEARAARVRARKKRVIGADKLRKSTFNLPHQSSRSGKRMWCLSEQRSLRVVSYRFSRS